MTSTQQRLPTLITDSVILTEDAVRILDRRVFPFERTYVVCRDHEQVAVAIEQMVTQSGGPFRAATAGMILAARQASQSGSSPAEQTQFLSRAAARLIATRRTNNQIAEALATLRTDIDAALAAGHDSFEQVVADAVDREWRRHDDEAHRVGEAAAGLVSDGTRILTHCWGESVIISTLQAILAAGKQVSLYATETRPYLQGARLTAESAAEMGIPTKVITDGMGASVMSNRDVDVLITAADRVTSDGYVINKIGTLQLAIAAKEFRVPYHALVRRPDMSLAGPDSVPMEQRDGTEVLYCRGTRTASWKVEGFYPAFDVTPPRFVTSIVTGRGVFTADALSAGYEEPRPESTSSAVPS